MELQFSERQRATVAAALTVLGTAVIIWAVWTASLLLARFVAFFSGVFLPLAVAAILAVLLRPIYLAVLTRVRYPAVAVAAVFLAAALPFVLICWFFGSLLLDQLTGLVSSVPHWLDRLQLEAQQRLPRALRFWQEHELGPRLRAWVGANSQALLSGLGSVSGGMLAAGANVIRTVGSLFGWAVLPVYLAYFLMAPPLRWEKLESHLPFLKPDTRQDVLYLLREFVAILESYFRGQLLVAGIQGLLYAVAFAVVGVPYGLAIGLLMGVLNVVPYLGSAVGLLLAVPLGFAEHGLTGLLAAGGAFAVVQVIESYFITPRIMGDRTGLHPLVIMVALFFWGAALGGLLGLILAIPLTAFFVVLWRLAKTKYIRAIV
jgi:predicted PurR-regulated permease PerM